MIELQKNRSSYVNSLLEINKIHKLFMETDIVNVSFLFNKHIARKLIALYVGTLPLKNVGIFNILLLQIVIDIII